MCLAYSSPTAREEGEFHTDPALGSLAEPGGGAIPEPKARGAQHQPPTALFVLGGGLVSPEPGLRGPCPEGAERERREPPRPPAGCV